MEYAIYTYGGGELLVSIFNAIAMIFASDNTYLTPVGSMAMTLGGVYAGTKAIFRADIISFSNNWMLPSLIAFLLLFSPKATVWIKDDAMATAPVKVDNIPFGIAFFTSTPSIVSHKVSKLLEETMLPVEHSTSHVGLIYGAKAIAKIRDAQIQDPTLLRNTKEYMRQCYTKPYVIGNFGGHKAAAIRAPNILDYLEKYPVKAFGIKWSNEDGSNKFMTCTEAGISVKKAIEEHVAMPSILSKLSSSLGLVSSSQDDLNRKVNSMVTNTLGFLEQSQKDAHEWMKQAMVLNANRESYDDWREKVGHNRVFPELIRMQATRGMFQQGFGSIIGAEMAESLIPVAAQPVMLAIVMMCFVIVMPLSLLPGGWNYIVTGVKLMVWVCSWPVFYTIIHAIAMIQLKNSIGGWGEDGLSLIGQAGFTELILMKYSTVQGLVASVPFISFAIVFGSPYALSSIAGSVAGVSSSASIGANMAEGNLSMNQVAYGNVSKYQRQEAPSLVMGGGVIDDGGMRVLSDGSGNQIITEHQDQLSVNYNSSEAITSSIAQNLANARSQMASISERESEQVAIVDSQTTDVARNIAHGTSSIEGLSVSGQAAIKKAFNVGESTSKNESASDSKSVGDHANFFAGIPGYIGIGVNASDSKDARDDLTDQERQDLNYAREQIKQAIKSGSVNSTSSDDMRLNDSLSANLSKQEQIATEKANMQQNIDTLSSQLSYVEQNSGTINRNVNDQVIKAVMQDHPELKSKEQAVRWMNAHRTEVDEIAKPIINNYNPFEDTAVQKTVNTMKANTPSSSSMEIASSDSLENKHNNNVENVRSKAIVVDETGKEKALEDVVKEGASGFDLSYNGSVEDALNNNLTSEEKEQKAELDEGEYIMDQIKEDIEFKKQTMQDPPFVRGVEYITDDLSEKYGLGFSKNSQKVTEGNKEKEE